VCYAVFVKNLVQRGCCMICKCTVVGMCLVEVTYTGCAVECRLCWSGM
jgi:hypothetical protein